MAKQLALHFATNNNVKKNGIFYVPFSKLRILKGFNDREDYGGADLHELAESIYQVGPKVPLKGYKEGEYYIVIVGHRRMMAAELIKKKYGKNVIFPIMMYPPGTQKKDLLLDTLLTNSGKDLTPLEKASTVSKLIAEKVSTRDIATSLGGVSEVYVKNLARLWTVPDRVKKLIRDGVVSATLVMGFLKSKGNMEEFIQEIEKQAKEAEKEAKGKKSTKKKQAKVTKKSGSKDKPNGVKNLKEFLKWYAVRVEQEQSEEKVIPKANKRETLDFVTKVINNEVSYKEIVDYFTT